MPFDLVSALVDAAKSPQKSLELQSRLISTRADIATKLYEIFGDEYNIFFEDRDNLTEAADELISARIRKIRYLEALIAKGYLEYTGDCWNRSLVNAVFAQVKGYSAIQCFIGGWFFAHSEVLVYSGGLYHSLRVRNVNHLPSRGHGFDMWVEGSYYDPDGWFDWWQYDVFAEYAAELSLQVGLNIADSAAFLGLEKVASPQGLVQNLGVYFHDYPIPVKLHDFSGVRTAIDNTIDPLAEFGPEDGDNL